MEKKLRIRCRGAAMVPWKTLVNIQGELKSLSQENYQKLKGEMIGFDDRPGLGFSFPFDVWDDKGTLKIMDGNQRQWALLQMEKEGIEIPPELPASYVEADNEAEARQKLLAGASQYGTVSAQGLYEFSSKAGLDVSELARRYEFPEIHWPDFKVNFGPDRVQGDGNPPTDGEVFDRSKEQYDESIVKQIVLYYDTERYREVIGKLERLMVEFQVEDFSHVVGRLIDESIVTHTPRDPVQATPQAPSAGV